MSGRLKWGPKLWYTPVCCSSSMPWQGGDFPGVATGSAGNSQDNRIIHQQNKTGSTCFSHLQKTLVSPPANHGRCWPAKIAISPCQKNGDFNAQMLHVYPCILPLYHYLPTKLRDLWGKCSNICQHYGPAPGAGWLGPGASWQGAVEGFWLGDPRVTIGWKILPCSRLT